MEIADSLPALRAALAARRAAAPTTLGLVPTMGNLHAGHLALVAAARKYCEIVAASVFVNPLQFGPGEDLGQYPRTPERDAELFADAGVDLLFTPTEQDMYPYGRGGVRVQVEGLSEVLCGAHRAGHFSGVTTVVGMLFNLLRPDAAFFGEKDYQQLVVIRQMAQQLHFGIDVVGVPTVREADGLALSSRNQYLDAEERRRAPVLYASLCQAATRLAGRREDLSTVEAGGLQTLEKAGFRPDYFEVRTADLERPTADTAAGALRVLAAGWLGRARLIDNVPVAAVDYG